MLPDESLQIETKRRHKSLPKGRQTKRIRPMKNYIIKYCIFGSKMSQIWLDSYSTRIEAEAQVKDLRMADCHHIQIIKTNMK